VSVSTPPQNATPYGLRWDSVPSDTQLQTQTQKEKKRNVQEESNFEWSLTQQLIPKRTNDVLIKADNFTCYGHLTVATMSVANDVSGGCSK
jgi:hypothetical protein